jgi:integrase
MSVVVTMGRGKTREDRLNLPLVLPKPTLATGGEMKLTQRSLLDVKREAAAKKKSDYTVWDDTTKGFGLRLRDGKYTWIFQYKFGADHWRLKLGTFPPLTCEEARKRADAAKGQVADAKLGRGSHPAFEREKQKHEAKPKQKPQANTLLSFVSVYLDARRGSLRRSSYKTHNRYLNVSFKPLHGQALASITRGDVAAALASIEKENGPVAANRARATLSRFFRWAIGEGLCDQNPVVGTNRRDENDPRERSLSDAEAASVWLSAPDSDYGRILKLILLTGCRRVEIGSLKWSEINTEAETITLPRERTKNHQEHVVPLSGAAMEIINSIPRREGYEHVFGQTPRAGFSNWSKRKEALDKVVNFKEPWTVHDLRRTVRTGLGELGIQPHIAEAVLNHIPPKLIRTYDRNKYESEKRDALDKWAAHLKLAVAQATGANVTAIKGRRR